MNERDVGVVSTGSVDNKIVAITGAASGMGKATAELFAERGATVELIDVSPDVAEVADSLGVEHAHVGDVRDSAFCTCLLYTSPSPRDRG